MSVPKAVTPRATLGLNMRRCIVSPCRAYLVLRSCNVSLQRPRPSPPADAGTRLLCSGPCDVGTYGRRREI
ncbi:unnamed protein product [Staurois parvus]|uniref:Uncharacterized protein n=1 Tax=Staurois parvus TaxID=386267 RepID=A0ABN9FAF4_9NEOB|nr:unnamed protein product [Staurois parvus]